MNPLLVFIFLIKIFPPIKPIQFDQIIVSEIFGQLWNPGWRGASFVTSARITMEIWELKREQCQRKSWTNYPISPPWCSANNENERSAEGREYRRETKQNESWWERRWKIWFSLRILRIYRIYEDLVVFYWNIKDISYLWRFGWCSAHISYLWRVRWCFIEILKDHINTNDLFWLLGSFSIITNDTKYTSVWSSSDNHIGFDFGLSHPTKIFQRHIYDQV